MMWLSDEETVPALALVWNQFSLCDVLCHAIPPTPWPRNEFIAGRLGSVILILGKSLPICVFLQH